MAITLGLVEAVDSNGVYVSMPGSRGVLRGPYRALDTAAVGTRVLLVATDGGEQVVSGTLEGGAAQYNVRTFGATGDGVTDDTSALQSAFTAAAGATVLIPPGTYKVTGSMTLPEDTTLRGAGATLTGAFPSGGSGVLKLSDGTAVHDLTVVNTHGTGGNWAISTNSASDVLISGCTIRGSWLIGLAIDYGSAVRVVGNLFDEVGMLNGSATPGSACALHETESVTIVGNTFTDCLQDAVYVAESQNVTVTGNTVRDQPEGVQVRVACNSVTVSNNSFTIKGSSVVSSFGVLVQTDAVDVVVSGNTFRTTAGTDDPAAGVRIDDESHRAVVTGNTFRGDFEYGVHVGTGAGGGTESIGCVISDNDFYDLSFRAIAVGAGENYAVVSNNRVTGGGDRAVTVAADYCVVSGNSVQGNVGNYGFTISGDFNSVTGNVANDVVNDSGFLISGTDNTITGNVATSNNTHGIHETGDRNLIVGNNCGGNDSAWGDIVWPGGTDTVIANNIGRVAT